VQKVLVAQKCRDCLAANGVRRDDSSGVTSRARATPPGDQALLMLREKRFVVCRRRADCDAASCVEESHAVDRLTRDLSACIARN
jgi:hypothetical protein